MEKIEHPLLIVGLVNQIAALIAGAFGIHVADPAKIVPEYIVMSGVVLVIITTLGLVLRSRLSVENPGKLQIVFEDLVTTVDGMLHEDVGSKGPRYFGIVATVGAFILIGNLLSQVPGFGPATSNINVTLALALMVWLYYHYQGFKEQGVVSYLKHFAVPPGVPVALAPLMLPIEIISHFARIMSLSLRLFGNIFGEHLVVLIIASLVPFVLPLPIMALGLIIGPLQAYIFMKLTMIYLGGAVATEHAHGDETDHVLEAV
jgi:F-type H+-transporting ATPase subunit a